MPDKEGFVVEELLAQGFEAATPQFTDDAGLWKFDMAWKFDEGGD